jgi:hypothetical protein
MEVPMKRRVLAFAAALVFFPGTIFAQPFPPMMGFPMGFPMAGHDPGPYLRAEIGQIQTDFADQKIGDVEVATLLSVRDRLSIASQKDAYVRDMGLHSLLLPGLGMIQVGDTAGGIGFMAADLTVIAGTLVAAYFSLPSDLRFDRIDYFNDNVSTINDAWRSHSFTEYLPAFGAVMAGMILDQTIRHWSAAVSRREAAQAIDEGRVTFSPRLGIGFMGFDVAY